jgi:hypothetical protein
VIGLVRCDCPGACSPPSLDSASFDPYV